MQLRWENFGVRRLTAEVFPDSPPCSLLIPDTTSLREMATLAEARSPAGFERLLGESVNLMHCVAAHVMDDWTIVVQPDRDNFRRAALRELDLTRLHVMVKTDSVPDFIEDALGGYTLNRVLLSETVERDLSSFALGLELPGAHSAAEVGLNLRNTQLRVKGMGGRLLLTREREIVEVPDLDQDAEGSDESR